MSELINDVALALTTGTGDPAGAATSKLGSLLPLALSWSHRFTLGVRKQCHYITNKQANKWNPYMHQAKSKFGFFLKSKCKILEYRQECTSAVFRNLCCGMTGSFHWMLTLMSEGGECIGASMRSS